ncbi:MAG: NAD(P)/FAD-dependent oxidoreductase, partial [Acidobacteriota bacterium]
MKNYRIVSIIGAGPAGLSASIQLNRFGIEHFIFDKSGPGGLLLNGNLIGNYTGVFPPVTGAALAEMMTDHFNSFSQEVIKLSVDRVDYDESKDKFIATTGSSSYFSDYIIAASGTKPVKPGIIKSVPADLLQYIDFGVTGLSDVKNEMILVVGGGDSAFDYALSLSSSNKVEIINRSERVKALKSLKEIVFSRKSIVYGNSTELGEIKEGDERALSVKL